MKNLPLEGRTSISGSVSDKLALTRESNPLYTESIIMRAAVPTAIPIALIAEMIFDHIVRFFSKKVSQGYIRLYQHNLQSDTQAGVQLFRVFWERNETLG